MEHQSIAPSARGNPDVLGILLASKCNISCRHCCNDSGPHGGTAISMEDAVAIIDQAAMVPSIREIGLSGGEPFLFIDLLKQIVTYASSRGLSSAVTSNGFWGQSKAMPSHLCDLKTRGLNALSLSTSIFHQEFLPVSRLQGAVGMALDAGLEVAVNVVETSAFGALDVSAALAAFDGRYRMVVMPLQHAGRALTDAQPDEYAAPSEETPFGNCRSHFRKLAIDARGDAYPCCSPGGFTDPLRLGNARELPLSAIVDRAVDSPLLAILEDVGPAFFLPFLRAAGIALPGRFSDQCELCHAMLSDPAAAAIVDGATSDLMSALAAQTLHASPA